MNGKPMTFDNGLSDREKDQLFDLEVDIQRLILRIEELPRHRSYSLAVTRMEEAKHWLRDRTNKPA